MNDYTVIINENIFDRFFIDIIEANLDTDSSQHISNCFFSFFKIYYEMKS
jgi:hypothetical protein